MRTSRWVLAASAAALMTLTACGEDQMPEPTSGEASSEASEVPSDETPSNEAPPDGSAGGSPSAGTPLEPSDPEAPTDVETPSDGGGSPSDVPPAYGDAVDGAVSDLAGDQGVDPSEVEVVSLEEVTWSDGSLGCPEPGMAYTQALVEGMRLVLAVGDEEFHYHGADDGYLSYCGDPMEPAETGDAVQ